MNIIGLILCIGFLCLGVYCENQKDIYTEIFFLALAIMGLIITVANVIIEEINSINK